MQSVIAVVSLKTIAANAEKIARAAGLPLIAVVKDDGYGHGAAAVAGTLERRASAFAVATADEGAALRTAGIQKDILVLTPPLSEEDAVRIAGYGLTATVSSTGALRLVLRTAERYALRVRAHIAVNTGMNRYGFSPKRLAAACRSAQAGGVAVDGVFSHFYAAGSAEARKEQTALFSEACERVREYFPDCVRHISATGGALSGAGFDAFRAGIALYGYLPEGFEGKLDVRPAMKICAYVSQNGTAFGGGIGYATAEKRYSRLHTLRLGYGDGFFRESGPRAEGKLCMDACVREGREKFGARRVVLKDLSAYAAEHGTTAYEALVHIGMRAEKIYI